MTASNIDITFSIFCHCQVFPHNWLTHRR